MTHIITFDLNKMFCEFWLKKLFQKRKDYNKSFNAVTILLLRMIFVYFLLNAKNKLHYMFLRKIHSFSTETSKFFNAWWDLILYAKLGIRNLLGISSTLLAWWLFNVNMIRDLWDKHFSFDELSNFVIWSYYLMRWFKTA